MCYLTQLEPELPEASPTELFDTWRAIGFRNFQEFEIRVHGLITQLEKDIGTLAVDAGLETVPWEAFGSRK